MKKVILILFVIALSKTSVANNFNYNRVDFQYGIMETVFNVSGKLHGIRAGLEVHPNIVMLVAGELGDFDFNIDMKKASIGVLFHKTIAPNIDFYISGNHSWIQVEAPTISTIDSTSINGTLGLRIKVNNLLELSSTIGFSDIGDGLDNTNAEMEIDFSLMGDFYLNESFHFLVKYSVDGETTTLMSGIRFYFNKNNISKGSSHE